MLVVNYFCAVLLFFLLGHENISQNPVCSAVLLYFSQLVEITSHHNIFLMEPILKSRPFVRGIK